ncbi:MAG: hypothetical protein GXO25_08345 [Euryarchaeota archaeon]|nr:hypothetical protein [Euryarchaeota archaeon]
MEYPEDVITTSKKGKKEVRKLVDYGKFVRYMYVDPNTGEKTENKTKLVLAHDGEYEEYFIIPLKQKGRFLLVPAEKKPNRKIWNDGEVMDLFDLLSL